MELWFLGGLSVEETAGFLKISPDSVKRDWRLAKFWLARELSHAPRWRVVSTCSTERR